MLQRPEEYGIGRLFEMMSDATVGADLQTGEIILWNPSAEALFGYSAAEAIGMQLRDLVPDEHVAAHTAGVERYTGGGEPVLVGKHPVEVPARTRSGEALVVQLTLSDVSADQGRRNVVAIIRDVTELRRAEDELRRTNDAMRLFLASASHDLRTPLASVLGFAELLEQQGPALDEGKRREFASVIKRNAGRASRSVEAILALSQIRAGVTPDRVQVVDLAAAAHDAVAMAGVEAEVRVPEGTCVEVDPDLLNRVLVNLVSNAEIHGAKPVTVEATPGDGFVDLVVTDHGQGVAPDVADRLFEPFARSIHSPQGGTGLGLAIVAELAESWGGSAHHEPGADGGARFGVRIPAAPGSSALAAPGSGSRSS